MRSEVLHSWGCIPANKAAGQTKAATAKEADWDQLFENALSMRWLYPPCCFRGLSPLPQQAFFGKKMKQNGNKTANGT